MRPAMINRIGLVLIVAVLASYSQETGPDIRGYLSLIENGQGEQVRDELPSLMSKYPNNPGVLYIQGLLTRDGAEAVRIYQSIVDNFPKSEWAGNALYKVYQFYYAIGLYRTAEMKMAQLKRDYPSSPYATRGTDVDTKGLAEEKEQPPVQPSDTLSPAPRADNSSAALPEHEKVAGPGSTVSVQAQNQFVLQVGAYSSQVNAEKQKVFFENLQFPVEVNTKVKGGRALYIVMIGSFGSYDEAKAKGVELRKKYNIESIVIAK